MWNFWITQAVWHLLSIVTLVAAFIFIARGRKVAWLLAGGAAVKLLSGLVRDAAYAIFVHSRGVQHDMDYGWLFRLQGTIGIVSLVSSAAVAVGVLLLAIGQPRVVRAPLPMVPPPIR